jgi:hypothetical protein
VIVISMYSIQSIWAKEVATRSLAENRPGSSLGNTLRGQVLRLSDHKTLVLNRLRREHVQEFTDESVTLAPDDLNHA